MNTSRNPAKQARRRTFSEPLNEHFGYYYTVNRDFSATVTWFLMHHVDLYTKLGQQFTLRSADLSNTDYNDPEGNLYVTSIDYTINPGMGTWQGQTELVAHAEPAS